MEIIVENLMDIFSWIIIFMDEALVPPVDN